MDLVGCSFLLGITLVVGDNSNGGRDAFWDVLEPRGHQADPVVEHWYDWRDCAKPFKTHPFLKFMAN